MVRLTPKNVNNFFKHVEITDTCWIWKGSKTYNGYGHLCIRGNMYLAHRISFFIHIAVESSFNLNVLHNCPSNLRLCVNPLHLYAGTQSLNCIDKTFDGTQTSRKLTFEQVREIKLLLSKPPYNMTAIADFYGVHRSSIVDIRNGRSYNYNID